MLLQTQIVIRKILIVFIVFILVVLSKTIFLKSKYLESYITTKIKFRFTIK